MTTPPPSLTATAKKSIQFGKFVILSKSFPRHLLHDRPVQHIYKNFNQKPGLTCFQLLGNMDDNGKDSEVVVENISAATTSSIYLTTWSGNSLVTSNKNDDEDGAEFSNVKNRDGDRDDDALDAQKLFVSNCVPHLDVMGADSSSHSSIAVLLCHGGRFAGGVFDCQLRSERELSQMKKFTIARALAHKTFHKYTVRKKQGKRQMNFDKSGGGGGGASTVGSQMRRNNEVLFNEELTELLSVEWSSLLQRCKHIFIHAPGVYNTQQLRNVLPSTVPITAIPFRVLKPTYQQVLIAFKRLMTVHVFEESQMQQIKHELEREDQESSGAVLSGSRNGRSRDNSESGDENDDDGNDNDDNNDDNDEENSMDEQQQDMDSHTMEKHRIDYEYYRMMSHNYRDEEEAAEEEEDEDTGTSTVTTATTTSTGTTSPFRVLKTPLSAIFSPSPLTSPIVSALLYPTVGRLSNGQEFTPTPGSSKLTSTDFWNMALKQREHLERKKHSVSEQQQQTPQKLQPQQSQHSGKDELVLGTSSDFIIPALSAAVVGGLIALISLTR